MNYAKIIRNKNSDVPKSELMAFHDFGVDRSIASVLLLLRSLPFQSADRIVGIYETHPQIPEGTEATFLDYLDWRAQQKSFEQIAAYSTVSPETTSLVVDGRAEQVRKVFASGNFFSLLGVSAQMGRTFE